MQMFVFLLCSPCSGLPKLSGSYSLFVCVHVLKLNFESIYYKRHISSLNYIIWIVMPGMFFQGQCIMTGAILIDLCKKL